MLRPGCGGFSIAMVSLSCRKLMVVDQVDIVDIAFVEAEDDAPVAGNRNAPEQLQIRLQGMKPVSGQVKVRWSAGVVEVCEGNRETFGLIGAHSAAVISLVTGA